MKEYCVWQKDIFRIMEKKGYTFIDIIGQKVPYLQYRFRKTKQIGENRFKEFEMNISVANHKPDSNWFSAEYRLELKEYSNNDKGHLNNYWGRTYVATASSFFYNKRTDFENLIKNTKYRWY